MANTTIKIKRSYDVATPSALKEGELAFSYPTSTLYIGGPQGTTVIPIGGHGDVTSVNTQTGDVVLTYLDVGAAPTIHTHTASQITDFTSAVQALIPAPLVVSVNGKVGAVVLSADDVGAALKIHEHTASEITDFDTAVQALIPPAPVVSVNGKTGAVVLSHTDVGAAATVHTHIAANITDFTEAVQALIPAPPVVSVNGKVGTVVLSYADVGAAPTDHQHIAANIIDFTEAVEALIPVKSVNGKTGEVVLTYTDVGAAPTIHSHDIDQINGFNEAVDSRVDSMLSALSLVDLADVEIAEQGNGQAVIWHEELQKWVAGTPNLSFLELFDAPTSYTGQAGKMVVVNNTETGLAFATEVDGGTF